MKIAICLIGNMTLRNRDWNRTKNNIYKNIIDCWGEGNEVSVHICSEQIPKDIVDFYKVKSYVLCNGSLKEKYLSFLPKLFDEDSDFFIFTRPDIVFLNEVSKYNLMFDKFNFLFREVNHWDRFYTCDNFYTIPKKFLIDFYETINFCPKVELFSGELHSQIYPCLVDKITKKNIHFIQSEPGFSGVGQNKFYLLDRYAEIVGDLGPTNIDDYHKWVIENQDMLEYEKKQIEKDTLYLRDED